MELANERTGGRRALPPVRLAVQSDLPAINRLLRNSPLSHIHVDWHLPVDWLGTTGFVVMPGLPEDAPAVRTGLLLRRRQSLRGCLAVAPDPLPTAWVRLAAIADHSLPEQILEQLMTVAIANLRVTGVTEVAWLAVESWPSRWLPALGFARTNEIETYVKEDLWLPELRVVPDLTIRPVVERDLDILAEIEAKAFAPLWQHSAVSLSLASKQALSFDVAELAGKVVGYQLSSPARSGAHLVRLTVAPEAQRKGVGSHLLAHAVAGYRRAGLRQVTLNTQIDNPSSQALYLKFGFVPGGQRLPVWSRSI